MLENRCDALVDKLKILGAMDSAQFFAEAVRFSRKDAIIHDKEIQELNGEMNQPLFGVVAYGI